MKLSKQIKLLTGATKRINYLAKKSKHLFMDHKLIVLELAHQHEELGESKEHMLQIHNFIVHHEGVLIDAIYIHSETGMDYLGWLGGKKHEEPEEKT